MKVLMWCVSQKRNLYKSLTNPNWNSFNYHPLIQKLTEADISSDTLKFYNFTTESTG